MEKKKILIILISGLVIFIILVKTLMHSRRKRAIKRYRSLKENTFIKSKEVKEIENILKPKPFLFERKVSPEAEIIRVEIGRFYYDDFNQYLEDLNNYDLNEDELFAFTDPTKTDKIKVEDDGSPQNVHNTTINQSVKRLVKKAVGDHSYTAEFRLDKTIGGEEGRKLENYYNLYKNHVIHDHKFSEIVTAVQTIINTLPVEKKENCLENLRIFLRNNDWICLTGIVANLMSCLEFNVPDMIIYNQESVINQMVNAKIPILMQEWEDGNFEISKKEYVRKKIVKEFPLVKANYLNICIEAVE